MEPSDGNYPSCEGFGKAGSASTGSLARSAPSARPPDDAPSSRRGLLWGFVAVLTAGLIGTLAALGPLGTPPPEPTTPLGEPPGDRVTAPAPPEAGLPHDDRSAVPPAASDGPGVTDGAVSLLAPPGPPPPLVARTIASSLSAEVPPTPAAVPAVAATAEVLLETVPSGARVIDDREPLGETPLLITLHPVAPRTLTLWRRGYRPTTVEVRPSDAPRLVVDLERPRARRRPAVKALSKQPPTPE